VCASLALPAAGTAAGGRRRLLDIQACPGLSPVLLGPDNRQCVRPSRDDQDVPPGFGYRWFDSHRADPIGLRSLVSTPIPPRHCVHLALPQRQRPVAHLPVRASGLRLAW
jgi:hypothetical protein